MAKISKKIINLLDESKVKFEIVEHKTTYTAFDTAATGARLQIKPTEIAKTLVIKADSRYLLAMIPSVKMLDKAKLKKIINDKIKKEKKILEAKLKKTKDKKELKQLEAILNKIWTAKQIDFAKESWMKKSIPGKIGAVPPFSEITKLQIFIDSSLLKQKNIYLGSGEYESLIKMTPAQYQKLEKDLAKGNFAKVKK